MSLYDLKIKRLALLLLPTFYRKPLIAAFAQSMVQGVNIVYGKYARHKPTTSPRSARWLQTTAAQALCESTTHCFRPNLQERGLSNVR